MPQHVDKATQEKRIEAALFRLGWRYPWFLPIAVHCELVCEEFTSPHGGQPTAVVDSSGKLYFAPSFAAALTDDELMGVLAHELSHLVYLHNLRREDRDPYRWNVAADQAINAALAEGGIPLPRGAVYPPAFHEHDHAEALYELLPEDTTPPQGGVRPTAGCGVEDVPSDGQGDEDSPGQENGLRPNTRDMGRLWREVAAQARNMARDDKGRGAGKAFARLLEVPRAKVKWADLLRNCLSAALLAHGYDETSFTRRSRRSQPQGPQFPGGVTLHCSAAVVIDTSGSMSDKELEACVANTVAICLASPVKVYLVTHDDKVQWKGWLKVGAKAADIAKTIRGRGGTTFREAYEAVGEAARRFDVMIHLTDGGCYDAWPAKPRNVGKLIVGLLGWQQAEGVPPGARIIDAEI